MKESRFKNTRNLEKYVVSHANTKRYQNSSIIHMQTTLNSNEAEMKRLLRKLEIEFFSVPVNNVLVFTNSISL